MKLSYTGLVSLFLLSSGVTCFQLPTFTVEEILASTPETASRVWSAVSTVGMFSVIDSNYKKEQTLALKELVQCIHSGAADKHALDFVLKDRTHRTTLATHTNASRNTPFATELEESCPNFVQHSTSLRQAAAVLGFAYAALLDSFGGEAGGVGPYALAVTQAESLEHFHLFRQPEPRSGTEPALQLHTDLGMFLVMTPPQYFNLENNSPSPTAVESGFRLQLPTGEIVHPEFPAGSLLVMNGEAAVTWVPSPAAAKLYVPPHEVVLPAFAGLGRAWYGRMFLPLRAAQRQNGDKSFHQFWTEASATVLRVPDTPVPLADGDAEGPHRKLLVSQGNCSAGFLYCWMQCMSTQNVSSCTPECSDPAGALWPENYTLSNGTVGMCPSCTLRCSSTSNSANAGHSATPSAPLLALCALLLLQLRAP